MKLLKNYVLISFYVTGLCGVAIVLDPSMSNKGVFLFVALFGIALFKLIQGFKIIFISEFKTLDQSPNREIHNERTKHLRTIKLDDEVRNQANGIKTFYPFKASRVIKLSSLLTLLSYLYVIYFIIENQSNFSIFSIFILWAVLGILHLVSSAPFTTLGNFYQHREWGDLDKRTGYRHGKKDERYKDGYSIKPGNYTYKHREATYIGPDYLKLWEKSFNLSWIWIFCSTLVIPFI